MAGNNYLPTDYQAFIHLSRYSRWLPDENRRESWQETVFRLINFIYYHTDRNLGVKLDEETLKKLEYSIIS